jgi:hypothetical protein
MRVALPLCALVSGCDLLFGIDRLPDAELCAPIGHDEDGDSLDDSCDPCPFSADHGDDADEDRIAIPCDPDPMTKNEVLLFSGFDPITRSLFEVAGGSFVDDELRASGIGTTSLTWGMDVDRVWVIAHASVERVPAVSVRELAVVFDAQLTAAAEVNGTYCSLSRISSGDYVQIYARNPPEPDAIIKSTPSDVRLTDFDGTLRATYARAEAPAVACTFSTASGEQPISVTPEQLPPPGRLALTMTNLDASLHFLFVTRRP